MGTDYQFIEIPVKKNEFVQLAVVEYDYLISLIWSSHSSVSSFSASWNS